MDYKQETLIKETDTRVRFRRVSDNSIYCVMLPKTVERYRKAGTLEQFLREQRESGIVIRTFR